MLKDSSGGFSLIEVTIVLAITAGLLAVALAGQTAVRGQAQFTGTVNDAVTRLEAVRNSAQTSSNDAIDAYGTDPTKIVFGKLVQAHVGDSFLTVSDIIGTNMGQTTDCAGLVETLSLTNSTKVPLNWGAKVSGSDKVVTFHRQLCTGALHSYNLTGLSPTSQTNYSETPAAGSGTVAIDITDTSGRSATITVDGAHNGAITVRYH